MPGILPWVVMLMCSLLIPGKSQAGLLATWSMQQGNSMIMEFQDHDNFRINVGKHSYILMSQGKGYTVSHQGDEWVATSIDSIRNMMEQSGMGDLMKQAQADRRPEEQKGKTPGNRV